LTILVVSNAFDAMDAGRLLAISGYWSYWGRESPASVRRDVDLPPRLSDSLALVVQGVRRCGKSTLLGPMVERYRLDRRHCAFLNFEDPRLGQDLDHSLLDAWVGGPGHDGVATPKADAGASGGRGRRPAPCLHAWCHGADALGARPGGRLVGRALAGRPQ
jgi:hypothetical protein